MATFSYYTSGEADQFTFYRIPKALFTPAYKDLSCEAKVLYGLCLDRMSLSLKKGWVDSQDRVYIIFTIGQIQDMMSCGKDKAVKILAELDAKKGIGLIEKVRQGQGKPDIIYVKNFAAAKGAFQNQPQAESRDSSGFSEVGKSEFKKSEKSTSRGRKNRLPEVGKSEPTKNNNNKTDSINNSNPINPINTCSSFHPEEGLDRYDRMDEINTYRQVIKENVGYDALRDRLSLYDQDILEELTELITETVSIPRETMVISGVEYPWQVVKGRLLKLNHEHIQYVMGCLRRNQTEVRSIRGYMLTCLFNAPSTMQSYYQSLGNYNMANYHMTGG